MPVSRNALGMNARNYLYIRAYNGTQAKQAADDKLLTKQALSVHALSTPKLIYHFKNHEDIRMFDWHLPSEGFAIKPARGYGGGGIIAFKSWDGRSGQTVSGETLTIKDLEAHILDILDGAYSLQYIPDYAFIEELVIPHPFFRKITPVGLPDIRVIVFNNIPIMAMVRVPTEESRGKANLALGAFALGIDMRTGITSHAYSKHAKPPKYFPGTKTKVRGLKIPGWDEILLLAAKAAAVSGLGFSGIDIVIDSKKGPRVLEINARPGLSIQNANSASLRTRLERVENLQPLSPDRGVEVAKSLFTTKFSEKIDTKPIILGVIEEVKIDGPLGGSELVEAKIDTGAYRTSIDESVISQLQIPLLDQKVDMKSASGLQSRPTAKIQYTLGGKKIKTVVTVADRSHMNFKMIIGRRDMQGFLVDPYKNAPAESTQENKFLDVE